MTTSLHISRVRLKTLRGEALASIAPLLMPADPDKRPAHAHRVLWLLFQDIADAERDFLWREEGDGRFMLLSHRPPTDPKGLFDIQTKPFTAELEVGDRLAFVLRANPVIRLDQQETRTTANDRVTPKRKKVDVVMHALRAIPKTEWDATTGRAVAGRAIERDRIVSKASLDWIAAQAAKVGAEVVPESVTVSSYTQVPLDRRSVQARRAAGSSGRPGGFSTVDLAGQLIVREPALFLDKLARGFGSAKAFGCGLMLIRRA